MPRTSTGCYSDCRILSAPQFCFHYQCSFPPTPEILTFWNHDIPRTSNFEALKSSSGVQEHRRQARVSGGGARLGQGEGKELAPYAYRSHRAPEEHSEVPAVPKFPLHFPTKGSGFSKDCNDVISGRIRPFHGQVLPDHRARRSRGSWRKVGKPSGTWGGGAGMPREEFAAGPPFLGHPPPLSPEDFPP